MMVEELLQLLVCVVDTQLLKGIEFEYFKASNIQNTDEKVTRGISRKSSVDSGDNPVKKSLENSFTNGTKSVRNLRTGLSFCDELSLASGSCLSSKCCEGDCFAKDCLSGELSGVH